MHEYGLKSKRYCFFLLCGFLLAFLPFYGQGIPDGKVLTYEEVKSTVDTTLFSPSILIKVDNDTLRLAFQHALSYYPKLWGKKIRVKYGKVKTTMTSRPRILSVFRKRNKRSYKITIGNKNSYKPAQLVNTAPFNALVGVFGHELAHILDYSDRSGWTVTWMGIKYVFSKKYRRQMEHYTDSLAMSKGLQWQIYRYSRYVIHDADIEEDYRLYKLSIYKSPEQVYNLAVQLDSIQNIKAP
ncbi:MAG: hypothetical protein LBG19_01070 [Prevotellaceae bacterium]|jgi:hypothetical protein|nr:hypothetical protein [Prevotellaceae bacterium]